jgi:endonuclease YncB( thermonuclease family)
MGCRLSSNVVSNHEVDRPPSPKYNKTGPIAPSPKKSNEKLPVEHHKTSHNKSEGVKPQDQAGVAPKKKNEIRSTRKSWKVLCNTSPHYDRLPPRAKKCKVKSVYDGDTITLYNKRRVRLLGIDTPELQNPTQAFSQAAKDYTSERCLEQQIWITLEDGGEEEDRYGRLLAWVWIDNGDGTFECVNEGLLKEGLATVYTPSKGKKLRSMEKLLSLQKEARTSQQGLWNSFQDYEVVKTSFGTAFHHKNGTCEHLKRSKNQTTTQATIALDEGRHACRTCLAENQATSEALSVSIY